ncbi:type II toxin-antitoxin system RelE/ParE family toxin [Herbiconiux sp. KACC 21604]|uniref:type II toxin-antitoxin system RelE family toxin n=1 Tax=unclassified Herbiconiux TaxID=2618217 RepID=UPI0014930887|nr:type II toxin-antitoxin system RelE/ParE family toxin [Herbiconiux sp. SALV-R1]QJU52789.1 type II toxin-antitoxin system RelE/ParE family toxin [Herbiconiux sp. SALV-R1]WPO87695.1 type II toxin-antitoxin system RelE/ParE family toxin [Herbiconiux sp. KACC 21604]
MTRWKVETSPEFDKAFRKLDRAVAKRVLVYLDGLLELDDPRSRGKRLSGDLGDFWRYRIGDYRLVVRVRDQQLIVVAVQIGHRSRIY